LPLKTKIRELINEIGGLLEGEIDEPNLDFAFRFKYPNPQIGRAFIVVKQKRKEILEIQSNTILSSPHHDQFTQLSFDDKREFIKRIHQITLNYILTVNFKFEREQRFGVSEKIYLEDENEPPSVNVFYKAVRRIFSCVMSCVIFIQDYFSGEYNPDDFTDNPPFYT
jgi:hypothetical protein